MDCAREGPPVKFAWIQTRGPRGSDRASRAPIPAACEEFKSGAVRLVLDEGKSVGAAARDLDLTESSLRNWVEQARADSCKGKPGV